MADTKMFTLLKTFANKITALENRTGGGSVVDIAHGGTNATTASAALANLGASPSTIAGTLTLKGGVNVHHVAFNPDTTISYGYYKIAEFTLKQTYANSPVALILNARGWAITYVEFCLSNGATIDGHTVAWFRYAGQPKYVYLWQNPDKKETFQLWTTKEEPYGATEVDAFLWNYYISTHFDWQWTQGWAKELPSGAISPDSLFPNIITDAEVAELSKKLTG